LILSLSLIGPKSSVHTFGHYVVIVSPPFIPSASATSATVRNHVARVPNATASDITKVTIFDIDNNYVAFSSAFAERIREMFEGWGDLYVLGSDGMVCLMFIENFDWMG
jgi:vacuolar protein sorting-associated protein 11